jgi:hypothetical protein
MVKEPSHVKQLSLNHVCKIGLSQPKSAVHQHPAKLSWQIISSALPLFSGSVAVFASYWSAGFESANALVSHLQAVRQLS